MSSIEFVQCVYLRNVAIDMARRHGQTDTHSEKIDKLPKLSSDYR
ncbi:hypothetical protein [Marinilactibacillus psychrotolerans]|nr:hypothetical protein [Marinilactibacillus psychrotolerans]